jgi:hypothetical protein
VNAGHVPAALAAMLKLLKLGVWKKEDLLEAAALNNLNALKSVVEDYGILDASVVKWTSTWKKFLVNPTE